MSESGQTASPGRVAQKRSPPRHDDSGDVKRSRTVPSTTMEDVISGAINVEQFEADHVHDVYNAIAPHFSATRYKPWPRVEAFVRSLPPYTLVADVGCGNGKYFGCAQQQEQAQQAEGEAQQQQQQQLPQSASPMPAAKDATASVPMKTVVPTHRFLVGLDYSEPLLRQTQRSAVDPNYSPETRVDPLVPPPPPRSEKQRRAQARKAAVRQSREQEVLPRTDVVVSEGRHCPLRGGLFDAVLSIAVIHHYAAHERRVAALRELLRLVRPDGGQVLVYVWAYEQPVAKQQARGVDAVTGDALVKWELNEKFDREKRLFHRYYHFFREGELERLCAEAAQSLGVECRVVESWYDLENWCVRLERVS